MTAVMTMCEMLSMARNASTKTAVKGLGSISFELGPCVIHRPALLNEAEPMLRQVESPSSMTVRHRGSLEHHAVCRQKTVLRG